MWVSAFHRTRWSPGLLESQFMETARFSTSISTVQLVAACQLLLYSEVGLETITNPLTIGCGLASDMPDFPQPSLPHACIRLMACLPTRDDSPTGIWMCPFLNTSADRSSLASITFPSTIARRCSGDLEPCGQQFPSNHGT